jgi:hypothetical protein
MHVDVHAPRDMSLLGSVRIPRFARPLGLGGSATRVRTSAVFWLAKFEFLNVENSV